MITALLLTLAICLGIQAIFFAFAATLRTDKVTDLSYGLTFVIVSILLLVRAELRDAAAIALVAMVCLWGVRLAGYLLFRIIHMKRDKRFDGIREHPVKFLQFWTAQGVLVWLIMLPAILWFAREPAGRDLPAVLVIGGLVWFVGLAIETIADAQKFRYKARLGEQARWMSTGLWRYSRHPNYFGELLCWWGVFLFTIPGLGAWAILALVGPGSLTYILLYVTGIPTLDASALRKWGDDPAYQAYRRETSLLVPRPPRP